jgi:hypothetical protein
MLRGFWWRDRLFPLNFSGAFHRWQRARHREEGEQGGCHATVFRHRARAATALRPFHSARRIVRSDS